MAIERADVVCPFYRYDDGYCRVVCEGFTEDSSLVQQYRTKAGLKLQLDVFCSARCESCEIFRMLIHMKYTEE